MKSILFKRSHLRNKTLTCYYGTVQFIFRFVGPSDAVDVEYYNPVSSTDALVRGLPAAAILVDKRIVITHGSVLCVES